MDILEVIKQDHDEAFELIDHLLGLSTRVEAAGEVETGIAELRSLLEIHTRAEEHALYEACEAHPRAIREAVLGGYHEHALMDAMLARLTPIGPGPDGELKAALRVVRDLLQHHGREEEEGRLFPKLRRVFPRAEREAMGREMDAEKARLFDAEEKDPAPPPAIEDVTSHAPHPHNPDGPGRPHRGA